MAKDVLLHCPSCGAGLEQGELVVKGQSLAGGTKLNWVPLGASLGRRLFSEVLIRSWLRPAQLRAARCSRCRVGVFRY